MRGNEKQVAGVGTTKAGTMLDSLTSLRFFAAFMVFVWHAGQFITVPLIMNLQLGYVGVGFFYLLSGFILTYVYFDKLKTGAAVSIKKFYIARIAKLYPVHILTFIATIPLFLQVVNVVFAQHTKLKFLGAALANLTLTQSWIPNPDVHFAFNKVSWSISVEMLFYALFPLFVVLLFKFRRFLSVKNIVLGMAVIWLVMLVTYIPQQTVIDDWRLYILPAARVPDFFMGILIGMIFIKKDSPVKTFLTKANGTKYEVATLVILVVGIGLSLVMPQSIRFSVWLMPIWMFLIYVFAHHKGKVSQFLSLRPFVFLGEISFSFYMIHQIVIRYMAMVPLSNSAELILCFLVALVLSSLVYLLFEEPMRLRVKAFLEKRFVGEVRFLHQVRRQLVKLRNVTLGNAA